MGKNSTLHKDRMHHTRRTSLLEVFIWEKKNVDFQSRTRKYLICKLKLMERRPLSFNDYEKDVYFVNIFLLSCPYSDEDTKVSSQVCTISDSDVSINRCG